MDTHSYLYTSFASCRIDETGLVTNRPLAGTRPRGATAELDKELEKDLLSDEKEKAEHVMLVDLGRNDVGKVMNKCMGSEDCQMY